MQVIQAIATACNALRTCEETGNDWRHTWDERLTRIERDILPSGSGFDSGCTIDRDSNGARVTIKTSFHHMHESGMYDGWTEHKVIVTPDLGCGFNIRVTGRNRNGIKDYIADAMHDALSEEYKA